VPPPGGQVRSLNINGRTGLLVVIEFVLLRTILCYFVVRTPCFENQPRNYTNGKLNHTKQITKGLLSILTSLCLSAIMFACANAIRICAAACDRFGLNPVVQPLIK
jgi:hypothetical protein